MDRCNFCRNIMAYGENHTCSFDTFESTYSQSQQLSENASNRAQLGTPREPPHFDIFSDIQASYAQTNGNASSASTSENNEFWYRPENDFPGPFDISPVVMVSAGVGEEDQRGSDIPDMTHATGRPEDEMSRQEYRWLSCNNDIMNFMDSPECVIGTDHSDDSNTSALRNLVLNSDFLPRNNRPENDQTHVPEYVNDGHTSLEMPSSLYSNSKKTATCVMEHISSETGNNAVVGPLRMCPNKKKFSCPLCSKEFNCKSLFDTHNRTHTKEKPFVCKFCEKAFSQKCNLKAHIRTHTGEMPYECPVCGMAFRTSSARNRHQRNKHK